MKILLLALLILLAGCGGTAPEEQSPGAATRYLDNVLANEAPADRAAGARSDNARSPASGKPAPELGQSPIFSREAVPPRP